MKNNYSRIVLLVDRSGSMASIQKATVDGINEFINIQKKNNTQGTLKIVQFDFHPHSLSYDVIVDNEISKIEPLGFTQFDPRGMTPLYDAIGRTISDLGTELSNIVESDRPDHVIVCIVTDGLENSSKEFNRHQIKEMIEHQTSKYNWDFSYIGANQDAILTAQEFGILSNKALTYNANAGSTRAAFSSYGTYANTVSVADPSLTKCVGFTEEDKELVNQ